MHRPVSLLSLISVVLMSLLVQLVPATSATIAGTKCTKAGTTKTIANSKFTCIKSGKKLIWNKGVEIKIAAKPMPGPKISPEPSPTSTTTPAPRPSTSPSTIASPSPSLPKKVPTTRREKALAEVRRIYEANSGKNPASTVKYIISNDAPKNFEQMLKEVIPVSARFWADIFTPNDNFPIILGNSNNVAWVQNEMKKYGHNLTSWDLNTIRSQGLNSSRGDVRSNERSTITQYVIGDRASEGIPNNLNLMRAFVSHEYVHAVAVSILGDRHEGIPGWSVEGSANFFGFAITSLMFDDPESAMEKVNRENLRRPYYEKGIVPHALNKDDLHKAIVLSEKGGGGEGTTCAEPKILCYSAGALMTEVLVADYGFEKFVQWWKSSKTKNWEVAFEDIYGSPIDQWYEDIAIPYVVAESRAAVPEVAVASDGRATKKHSARPTRLFVEPGYKSPEALKALANWETMLKDVREQPEASFLAGSSTDAKLLEDIKNYVNSTLRYFSKYSRLLKPTFFYITNESDLDWFINELSKVEPGLSEQDKSTIRNNMGQWGDYSDIRSSNERSRIALGLSRSRLQNYIDSYRARSISGLTALSIQNSVTGGKSQLLPCWAKKGAEAYFGLASARQTDAIDYFVERVYIAGDWYQNRSKYNLKKFSASEWESFIPKVTGSANTSCEKDSFVIPVGFLFTELMVAQYGSEKIIDWWELTRTNGDWKTNFNQAFGVSYDSWQREFAIPYLLSQFEKWTAPLWWG